MPLHIAEFTVSLSMSLVLLQRQSGKSLIRMHSKLPGDDRQKCGFLTKNSTFNSRTNDNSFLAEATLPEQSTLSKHFLF